MPGYLAYENKRNFARGWVADGNCVATFVWFDRVDRFYRLLPHARYFSHFAAFVSRGTAEDREASLTPRLDTVTPNQHQLVRQVVEGAPQVLENVSDDNREVERNLITSGQIINSLSRLRIVLDLNEIRFFAKKGPGLKIKIVDVLFGPLNFYPDES